MAKIIMRAFVLGLGCLVVCLLLALATVYLESMFNEGDKYTRAVCFPLFLLTIIGAMMSFGSVVALPYAYISYKLDKGTSDAGC